MCMELAIGFFVMMVTTAVVVGVLCVLVWLWSSSRDETNMNWLAKVIVTAFAVGMVGLLVVCAIKLFNLTVLGGST